VTAVTFIISFKLWGHRTHLEALKKLCLAAGAWDETQEHVRYIRTATSLWQAFAGQAVRSWSPHSVKIAEEIYLKEQIAAVKYYISDV